VPGHLSPRGRTFFYPPIRRLGGSQILSGRFGEEKDLFLPRTEPLFPGIPDLSLVIAHSRSSRLPHRVLSNRAIKAEAEDRQIMW